MEQNSVSSTRSRNGYRMRRLRRNSSAYVPFLILLCVVAVAALVAILLGNVLGARAASLPTRDANAESVFGHVSVRTGSADAFVLGYGVDNMVKNGTRTVSVIFRDASGNLTYQSPAAREFAAQDAAATASLPILKNEIDYLHERNVTVSGLFSLAIGDLDGSTEYRTMALLSELSAAGADEILLDGVSLDASAFRDLLIAVTPKETARTTALGAVLSFRDFETATAAEAEATLRAALSYCDFFAVDLRGGVDADRLSEVLSRHLYTFSALPVRFLAEQSNTELCKLLTAAGFENLQILP